MICFGKESESVASWVKPCRCSGLFKIQHYISTFCESSIVVTIAFACQGAYQGRLECTMTLI